MMHPAAATPRRGRFFVSRARPESEHHVRPSGDPDQVPEMPFARHGDFPAIRRERAEGCFRVQDRGIDRGSGGDNPARRKQDTTPLHHTRRLGVPAQIAGGRPAADSQLCVSRRLSGLQLAVSSEMQHTVTALTQTTLCVFQRDEVWSVFKNNPKLAYSLTWMAARRNNCWTANS